MLKSLYVDDLASGSNNPCAESTLELANKIKTLVYAGAHIPKISGGGGVAKCFGTDFHGSVSS